MNSITPRAIASGCRIVLAACLLAAGFPDARAQVIHSVEVRKMRSFFQTSAGSLGGPNFWPPFQFSASINGENLASIAVPTLTGPSGPRSFTPSGGLWHHDELMATQALLDSSYPNGTYTVSANGITLPFSLNGDAYPNPPIVTLSGGAWVDGKYVIDPAQALSITTNAFTSYGATTDSAVHVFLGRNGANVFDSWTYYSSSPTANPVTLTVPAGTLVAGNEYYFAAMFDSIVDLATGAPARRAASYAATTNLTVKAETPQRFPVTVNANITTVATVTATFEPRPQDVGTAASVFVFALAPAAQVTGAVAQKSARFGAFEKDKADQQAGCVLAQLRADGRLGAVSASNMQAYVSGVLTGQQQAVTILNGVPTANVGGATFYIGYGSSSGQMLAKGVNQRAITVPGSDVCDPKPPQTGWWWNPVEAGRGYTVEVSGINLSFAAYLYDASGRASWYWASGETSLDGALFTKDLLSFSQGPTLFGDYRAPTNANSGSITLAFSNAFVGTIAWPGGVVPVERFQIRPNGLSLPSMANQPESGWWWNPRESGRGFFLEWQGGQLYMAGYMYDDRGDPIWYLSTNTTPSSNLLEYDGTWWQYGNGQTLTGAYRPPVQLSTNVGPVTIRFTGPTRAVMTLPGGRTIDIERYRF